MKKELLIVWLLLVILTIISAIVGNSLMEFKIEIILVLAAIKFLLVAFCFIDLKKAHIFWKSSILIFISLLTIFISFIIK